MCLLAFAHDLPGYTLVLAANRDEMHTRPAAPAAFWDDDPKVFGGRDRAKGGTWLALTRTGRLAALTNVRLGAVPPAPRSRGLLCADFVRGVAEPEDYAAAALAEREAYGGFNLVLRSAGRMVYAAGGKEGPPEVLAPGVYGLSNATLDVPWPKVVRAKEAMAAALSLPRDRQVESLFSMLAETGATLEASPFVRSSLYGTRASTVVVWPRGGDVTFEERTFGPDGVAHGVARATFRSDGP